MKETVAAQIAAATMSQESFFGYIAQQPQHIKWLLGNLNAQNVDPNHWLTAINNVEVMIATDGSVAEQKGYFAVTLHTENEQIWFEGPCDCNKALITSYRVERAGILSVLYLLQAFVKYTGCNIIHTQDLLCDNISAVNKTNSTIPPGVRAHITPNYDVIHKIMEVKQDVP
eukprot:5439548-Ditylum_brightwellii.AAC.1